MLLFLHVHTNQRLFHACTHIATRSVSGRGKSAGHGAAPSSNGGATESRSSGPSRSRRGAASSASNLKSAAGVHIGRNGLDAAAAAAADVGTGDLKKPAAATGFGTGNGLNPAAAAAGVGLGSQGLDAATAAAAATGVGTGGHGLDAAAASAAGIGDDDLKKPAAATGGGTGGQGLGEGAGAGGIANGQDLKKQVDDAAAEAAAAAGDQGKGFKQPADDLDDTTRVEDQGEGYSSGLFPGNFPPEQTHGQPLRHNDNNRSSFGSDDEDDSAHGDLHRDDFAEDDTDEDDVAGTKLQKFLQEQDLIDLSLIPCNQASKHQDDYDETYVMCYINDATKYNGDAAVIIQKTNNNKGTKIKKDMPYFVMVKFVCVVSNVSFVIIYPSHAAFQRAFYSFILNGGSIAGSMVIIKEPRSHDKHLQGDDCLIIESDEPVLLLPPDLKTTVLNSIVEHGTYFTSEDNHTKSFLFHHASLYCIAPHARESSCNNNFCDRKNLKTEKSHCPCPSSSRSSGMVLQCGIRGITADGQEFRDESFVSWDLTKLLIANVADSSRSWEDYEAHRSELKRKINALFQYVNTHGGFSAGLWQKRGNVTVVNGKETTVVLSNEVHPHLVFIRPTNPIDPSVLRSLQYSLPTPSVSALLNAQMD